MDLPRDVKDVDSNLVLDELSHIPPGLVTTYVQPFDVTSPLKTGVFKMYPVPQYYRFYQASYKVQGIFFFVCI